LFFFVVVPLLLSRGRWLFFWGSVVVVEGWLSDERLSVVDCWFWGRREKGATRVLVTVCGQGLEGIELGV